MQQLRLAEINATVFADVMPKLSDAEFCHLERLIVAEGCHDALTVWPRGDEYVLIDGHNRYRILARYGHIYAPARLQDFADEDTARVWIVRNQLARRNLTSERYADYVGFLYDIAKQSHGGNRKSNREICGLIGDTADAIGAEFGIPARTVEDYAKYHRALTTISIVDSELRDELLAGDELRLSKQDTVLLADLLQSADAGERQTGLAVIDHLVAYDLSDARFALRLVRQEQCGKKIMLQVSPGELDEIVTALAARNGAGNDGALLARLTRLLQRYKIGG